MKQKTCKLCGKGVDPYCITVRKLSLCKTCFDFMFEKYKTIGNVHSVLKKYNGGSKNA